MKLLRLGMIGATVLALGGAGVAMAAHQPAPASHAAVQGPADTASDGETKDDTGATANTTQPDNGQDGETADDTAPASK